MTRIFEAAGMTFEVRSEYPISDATFHPDLSIFETKTPGADHILIEHFFSIPDRLSSLDDGNALFSRPMWTIFRLNDVWVYKKNPGLPLSRKDIVYFEFDNQFTHCKVYSDFLSRKDYQRGNYISLTLFGCDQILMSRLLADRAGFVIHSNGFVQNRKGKLLAGPSGSGKTTLTGMLRQNDFQIAGDDRMIVTIEDDRAVMHGSWLHGTNSVISRGRHPLESIFFVEQAGENKIFSMEKNSEKISNILQSLVRPFIPASEWQFLLRNVEKLVRSVDCYRLLFDLSGNIIEMIPD